MLSTNKMMLAARTSSLDALIKKGEDDRFVDTCLQIPKGLFGLVRNSAITVRMRSGSASEAKGTVLDLEILCR